MKTLTLSKTLLFVTLLQMISLSVQASVTLISVEMFDSTGNPLKQVTQENSYLINAASPKYEGVNRDVQLPGLNLVGPYQTSEAQRSVYIKTRFYTLLDNGQTHPLSTNSKRVEILLGQNDRILNKNAPLPGNPTENAVLVLLGATQNPTIKLKRKETWGKDGEWNTFTFLSSLVGTSAPTSSLADEINDQQKIGSLDLLTLPKDPCKDNQSKDKLVLLDPSNRKTFEVTPNTRCVIVNPGSEIEFHVYEVIKNVRYELSSDRFRIIAKNGSVNEMQTQLYKAISPENATALSAGTFEVLSIQINVEPSSQPVLGRHSVFSLPAFMIKEVIEPNTINSEGEKF